MYASVKHIKQNNSELHSQKTDKNLYSYFINKNINLIY